MKLRQPQRAGAAAGRWSITMCLLLASAWLTGCPATNADPPAVAVLRDGTSHDMHRNTLMDAAFGASSQLVLPDEVYWQAQLALPALQARKPLADPAQMASASGADTVRAANLVPHAVAVRPREVVRISESQLVMVIESVPRDALPAPAQAGQPAAGRMPVYLGAIFYTYDASKPAGSKNKGASAAAAKPANGDKAEEMAWRPQRLEAYVDAMMVGTERPDVQVYKLASDRYLLTYAQRVCRQGYCGQWLKAYLLQPDGMAEVLHMRLSGSNAYTQAACATRLEGQVPAASGVKEQISVAAMIDELYAQPKDPAAAPPTEGAAASRAKPAPPPGSKAAGNGKNGSDVCYAIRGEIHPISRGADTADVSVRFTGLVSEANGQRRVIAQNQLFRLHGKRLVQIEGAENPLPSPELLP